MNHIPLDPVVVEMHALDILHEVRYGAQLAPSIGDEELSRFVDALSKAGVLVKKLP